MILDSRGKTKLYGSFAALFGLLAVFTVLVLPKSEIVIIGKERQFKKIYSIILDTSISSPLIPINRVPAIQNFMWETQESDSILLPEINMSVPKKHLIAFISAKITEEIDALEEQFDRNALYYTLQITDKDHKIATLYVESMIFQQIDVHEIKGAIRGKKIKEAREYLARLSKGKLVSFTVSPKFMPFVPFISERIKVTVL